MNININRTLIINNALSITSHARRVLCKVVQGIQHIMSNTLL